MGHRILLNTRVEPQLAEYLESLKYAGETTPAVIRRVIVEYSKNMQEKEAKLSDLELKTMAQDVNSISKEVKEIKKMLKILTSRSEFEPVLDLDSDSDLESEERSLDKLDFSGYKQLKNPAYE